MNRTTIKVAEINGDNYLDKMREWLWVMDEIIDKLTKLIVIAKPVNVVTLSNMDSVSFSQFNRGYIYRMINKDDPTEDNWVLADRGLFREIKLDKIELIYNQTIIVRK